VKDVDDDDQRCKVRRRGRTKECDEANIRNRNEFRSAEEAA
jgi:hypothetical protein